MCHPLEINKVQIRFDVNKEEKQIVTTAEVAYLGRTGVEMEALTAVSAACLTLYDMLKAVDKAMVISGIV